MKNKKNKYVKAICLHPHIIWIFVFLMVVSYQLPEIFSETPSNLLLFDFKNPTPEKNWKTLSDRSKGGASEANITLNRNESLKFSGVLQPFPEHNFGLAYSPPLHLQLRSYGGLLIRLRGDGKYYQIRLYNHTDIEGVFYQAGFNTHPNRLMTVFLPFSAFIPYLDHRLVRDWPVLDQSRIKRMGIAISDQAAGNFCLEIFWIKAQAR